ncbi:MAG: hypothetical protein UU93_C0002G0007 [Candidatus Amesbacteria bacterium GW2011_GWA2_42_12]|uniref:Transposase IS200-like domain-containing protein n=1 Tax=Candidatus Amesbacteria bacterium GW2011_GWA2_42_12 TaxID=1618356 RepID=A0A0G0Y8N6_9BACT|nr:MAG: hypothetical protein UU93_C0002G0007 [Candidatus Amesbacteria bacterium GW2011_GWA2_42_12]
MASKNSTKIYVQNSYYHIYNRGVEKRTIFQDEQDYSVFLSYLKTYLSPKDEKSLQAILDSRESSPKDKDLSLKLLRLKNYSADLELLCYALLPNHFHLLVRQKNTVINNFTNSLGTRYAMYFNRKYKRKGVLFQDVYKAVLVESEEQLLHLSRYIHLNSTKALHLPPNRWKESTFPSSIHEYLGDRNTSWIKKGYILNYFSKSNPRHSYSNFLGMSLDAQFIYETAIDMDDE